MSFTEGLMHYQEAGGVLFWLLMIVSFFMWLLILERYFYFRLHHEMALDVFNRLQEQEPLSRSGPLTQLIKNLIVRMEKNKERPESILDELITREMPHFERFASTIAVLSVVAPLLGLLGTVGGMIETFDVLQQGQSGGVRSISGGISHALITTQLGLMIAIPGIFFLTDLKKRLQRLKLELQHLKIILKSYGATS